jgi:hypothetical protein
MTAMGDSYHAGKNNKKPLEGGSQLVLFSAPFTTKNSRPVPSCPAD